MFVKGDILRCFCRQKKKINGKWIYSTDTQVRVISPSDTKIPNYRIYNITFDRYEIIGEIYLKKDIEYLRNKRISEILQHD